MVERQPMPGPSGDRIHTNSMCMCVGVYVSVCMCLCACICLYVCDKCVRLFQFQVTFRMKNAFPVWLMKVHVQVMYMVCVCVLARICRGYLHV